MESSHLELFKMKPGYLWTNMYNLVELHPGDEGTTIMVEIVNPEQHNQNWNMIIWTVPEKKKNKKINVIIWTY